MYQSGLLVLLLSSGVAADISYLNAPFMINGASRQVPTDAASMRRLIDEDGFPELIICPTACADEEFCGLDLKCHRYSCETWYKLAPKGFTGYDPVTSTELECRNIAPDEEDTSFLNIQPECRGGDMPAAVYQLTDACLGLPTCPSSFKSYDVTNFVQMNRKCTARPSPKTAFVCYDISPDTDLETYFADYLEATAGQVNSVQCGANETDRHSHFYAGRFQETTYTLFDGADSTEAFNASSVQTAMIGHYAEVEESVFPFCDPGCQDTEFCGRDLQCYKLNCNNMYLQGPIVYTGQGDNNEGGPGTLECFDTNPSDGLCSETADSTVFPVALIYECMPVNIFYPFTDICPVSGLEGRYVNYNRYCTAEPNPDQVFTCYDISPETDTQEYFEEYINTRKANPNCTAEDMRHPNEAVDAANQTVELVGSHQYEACLRNDTSGDCSALSGYDVSLESLDIDRAHFSMYSMLSGEREIPDPDSGEEKSPDLNLDPDSGEQKISDPDISGAITGHCAEGAVRIIVCLLSLLF